MIDPKRSNKFKNMSATGNVMTGAGRLAGILVSSSTSLTLKAQDGAATIFNTTGAITAPSFINCFNVGFTTSLVITIGGSGDFCVVYADE